MNPQRRDVILLLFQNQNDQLLQIHEMLARRRRRRRGRQSRNVWVRDWISRRPEQGLYDRLMVELRNGDPRSFQNFMRMPPAMFDEIVQRLTPRITKATTNWRAPLDPGLKVALTLRHLASGANYHDMQYAWRVPHKFLNRESFAIGVTGLGSVGGKLVDSWGFEMTSIQTRGIDVDLTTWIPRVKIYVEES